MPSAPSTTRCSTVWRCCADQRPLGSTGPDAPPAAIFNRHPRGQPRWVRIYRALNHARAQEACRLRSHIRPSRVEIEDFANPLVDLQDKRHRAHYYPVATFYRRDARRLHCGYKGRAPRTRAVATDGSAAGAVPRPQTRLP